MKDNSTEVETMSKMKKRIIGIALTLALVLGGLGLYATAAEYVPMPDDLNIARLSYDIYQGYLDGDITEDEFAEYLPKLNVASYMSFLDYVEGTNYSRKVSISGASNGIAGAKISLNDDGWGYGFTLKMDSGKLHWEPYEQNYKYLIGGYMNSMSSSSGGNLYCWGSSSYYIFNKSSAFSGHYYLLLNDVYTYGNWERWRIMGKGDMEISNFAFYILDYTDPGHNGWYATLEESGDADNTVYQIRLHHNTGDKLRPANTTISYDELATLQLNVQMESTSTASDKTYNVCAKAVSLDGNDIMFDFYDAEGYDKWSTIDDQIQITSISLRYTGDEDASYGIYDPYAKCDLEEKFGLTSSYPVTDLAGNPIHYNDGQAVTIKGTMTMDREIAIITEQILSVYNLPQRLGQEAGTASMCSNRFTFIFSEVVLNEELMTTSEARQQAKDNVYAVWSITDKDGNPLTTKLTNIYNSTDINGKVYSYLDFETLKFDNTTEPQGAQIMITEIKGIEYLYDCVGNQGVQNPVLMDLDGDSSNDDEFDDIWPNEVTYLDTASPTATLGDVVITNKESEDGKVESVQLTVPLNVSDYIPEKGLYAGTKGTYGFVALSNPIEAQEIEYKYAITSSKTFPVEGEVEWSTGILADSGELKKSSFMNGSDGVNVYLHMELSNLSEYEISQTKGLTLQLILSDRIWNYSYLYRNIEGIVGVDNVAPSATLSSKIYNSGKVAVTVNAKDLNGLSHISYRWVVDGVEGAYTDIPLTATDGNYPQTATQILTNTFEGDGATDVKLEVQVYDANNNLAEYTESYELDLSKAISQWSIDSDITTPSGHPAITVYAPVSESDGIENAMTRVTLAYPVVENGMSYHEIYFRLLNAADIQNGVDLFDPDATWYHLIADPDNYDVGYGYTELDGEKYYYYEGDCVEEVEGTPGWVDHYGEIDVYIASGLQEMRKSGYLHTGVVMHSTINADASYTWQKIGTVLHSAAKEDVYTADYIYTNYLTVTDASGEEHTFEWDDDVTYRYVTLDDTLAGTRLDVALTNALIEDWTWEDIDFDNSYAVLVKADADGNLVLDDDGNYIEVTERQNLARSLTQTLVAPPMTKDGEQYSSGVYTWVLHIQQRGGKVQEFGAADAYTKGNAYLILDSADLVQDFSISQTNTIEIIQGYGDSQAITETKVTEEGMMAVLNIGTATVSESMYGDGVELHEVDGITAYSTGIFNSLAGQHSTHPQITLTFTADVSGEESYGTYLGQEIGTVEGIRFWNDASTGDYEDVYWVKENQKLGNSYYSAEIAYENGVTEMTLSLVIDGLVSNSNYDEATVAETHKRNFRLIDGSNTICYQFLMSSGVVSPVYQFELNLVKEVPQVDVDIEYGPYYTSIEDWDNDSDYNDGVPVRYAQDITVHFSDVFSNYSGLRVYYCSFDNSDTSVNNSDYTIRELTADELSKGFTITRGCELATGYSGTNVYVASGRFTSNGSNGFFVVTDNTGNAVAVYPLDNREYGLDFGNDVVSDAEYTGVYDGTDSYYEDYQAISGSHRINFASGVGYGHTDTVSFQLDDYAPTDLDGDNDGFTTSPNCSGVTYLDSYGLYFLPEYDPDVEEGELISHTAIVTLYGERATDGLPNYTKEYTFEFEAENIKPAIVEAKTVAGSVELTYNIPVTTSDGRASRFDRIVITDESMYGTDYEHSFTDVYGNIYTETIHIGVFTDPTVTYSTTDITTENVTVTIDSSSMLYLNDDELGYYEYDETTLSYSWVDIVTANCNCTEVGSNIVLTFPQNYSLCVYYDADYTEVAAYIEVNNIVSTLEVDPYISWNYNAGDVVNGVVYGEVTAYLMDKNGAALIDPATGQRAKFTFYPGGPTEYTFSGCVSQYGKDVEDVTAKLAVTLEPEPTTEADTMAPDTDIVSYVTLGGKAYDAEMVYRVSSGRFEMNNHAFWYGDDCYYDDLTEMVANLGWADSYMFHFEVFDESRVRLILRSSLYEEDIHYDTTSEAIAGVTLVGRTLEIKENTEFALYLVDEEDNVTAIHFLVTTLGDDPPLPEIAQVLSVNEVGDPVMRLYLLPPQLEGYSNLTLTNDGATVDEEKYDYNGTEWVSDYYGYSYIVCSQDGTYKVYYSYDFRGVTYTGEIDTDVTLPDMTPPAVTKSTWSENYYLKYTNQDVTLQLDLNLAVQSVNVVYDLNGVYVPLADDVLEAYGLTVSFFQEDISVFYSQNSTALETDCGKLYLKMTGLENNQVGYYALPTVDNIDRVGPSAADISVEFSDNHRSATVTITTDEVAISQNGYAGGTTFQFKVYENGTHSYNFIDPAGNSSTIEAEVTGLITEDLKITVSTSASIAGVILDPATYEATIGQTLYIRTNRAATVQMEEAEDQLTADPTSWTAITVTENSMGLHPTIVAEDEYGNMAIVQLEYIPPRDVVAPALIVDRVTVSVSSIATAEEIEQALLNNILYYDNVTVTGDLTVTLDYVVPAAGSKAVVTYTVTDEAGNATSEQCWLRVRSGTVPGITVSDGYATYQVDENMAIVLSENSNSITLTISYSNGVVEPYKLVYEAGLQDTWAKLKDGIWLTDGYVDDQKGTYELTDLEAGWYSFALVTQSGEVYYFELHIGK